MTGIAADQTDDFMVWIVEGHLREKALALCLANVEVDYAVIIDHGIPSVIYADYDGLERRFSLALEVVA